MNFAYDEQGRLASGPFLISRNDDGFHAYYDGEHLCGPCCLASAILACRTKEALLDGGELINRLA